MKNFTSLLAEEFKIKLLLSFLFILLFSFTAQAQNEFSTFEFEKDIDYKIILVDGSEFIGRFLEKDSSTLTISTTSLPKVEIPFSKIKSVTVIDSSSLKKDGSYWFPNPHSTRYFFSPSGLNLKKGEGYYQNTYLLFNSVNYGLTDNISLGGGLEFISTFTGQPIYYVTPKVGFDINEKLNLGAGVLVLGVAGEGSLGITYGIATYGSRDDNLTAGLGWGFVDGDFSNKPIITLSGMKRLKRKFSIVSENWFVPIDDSYEGLFGYGMRIFSEKLAVDIGLLNNAAISDELVLGVPYIDLVVKF
tara:strand:- start:27036 stop:27944 length:909 start_codon:yes stop_codon:yes gene_type:complete